MDSNIIALRLSCSNSHPTRFSKICAPDKRSCESLSIAGLESRSEHSLVRPVRQKPAFWDENAASKNSIIGTLKELLQKAAIMQRLLLRTLFTACLTRSSVRCAVLKFRVTLVLHRQLYQTLVARARGKLRLFS